MTLTMTIFCIWYISGCIIVYSYERLFRDKTNTKLWFNVLIWPYPVLENFNDIMYNKFISYRKEKE